jgi:5-formaminoimidazole-4-carboxamide-1-beta-D-ribofuranosyl 5'-monophosphate synthetase
MYSVKTQQAKLGKGFMLAQDIISGSQTKCVILLLKIYLRMCSVKTQQAKLGKGFMLATDTIQGSQTKCVILLLKFNN